MNNQMPYQYGMMGPGPVMPNQNMYNPNYGQRELEMRVDRLEREMKRVIERIMKLEKQHNNQSTGNVPYQPYSYNMM